MKKIKLFLVSVVCALCLCISFAGCSNGGAEYVENSFTATNFYYYDGLEELDFSYSFKVNLYQAGGYTVKYDVCQTDSRGVVIARESCESTLTRSAETDKTEYSISRSASLRTNNSSQLVKLENVKITLDSTKKSSVPYAIGFGSAGGLLLCGLVILFILDKTGKLDKKK